MEDIKLLTRDDFRNGVFDRDNHICVVPGCSKKGVDAHHIIERRLWSDGGYYLNNGATLCEEHHKLAEINKIFPQTLREWIGTTTIKLPPQLSETNQYTKWGDLLEQTHAPHKKYGTTVYLPFSYIPKDHTRDVGNLNDLICCPLSISIKMDGSNFKANSEKVTARNGYSADHLSFDMLKRYHAAFKYKIPKHLDLFGEWLYAKHSIHYIGKLALSHYCQLFAVFNRITHMWEGWDSVGRIAKSLGLVTTPDLGFAWYEKEWQLIKSITQIAKKIISQGHEGIVVRNIYPFHDVCFSKNIMKFVRQDHVQTSIHWSSEKIIKNELIGGK